MLNKVVAGHPVSNLLRICDAARGHHHHNEYGSFGRPGTSANGDTTVLALSFPNGYASSGRRIDFASNLAQACPYME